MQDESMLHRRIFLNTENKFPYYKTFNATN